MDELTSGILKAINNQTGNHFDTYLLIADGDGRTLLSGAISQGEEYGTN